jgi:hypothetical protein
MFRAAAQCYPPIQRCVNRSLDIIYFDAGGGHRAAATALQRTIEEQNLPWKVRLVHLKDILGPIDIFKKLLRIDLQEIYNQMLRRGWTLGSPQGLRFMQLVIRFYHQPGVRLMRDFWKTNGAPDMVVSVVPNFNRALCEGFQAAAPGRPYVTILTDLADYPPHFWIERQQQYFICGTPRAVQQAQALGHPPERIFQTSGMILNPRSYEPLQIDRSAVRVKLGLDPARPTGLVLFGGYGSGAMSTILDQLDAGGLDLQLIFICGRNEKLKARLQSRRTRIATHIVGFTQEVPYFMHLSDFFLGKPGPGSLSEALAMHLPAITERNIWTLPQERYNATWLEENHVGFVIPSFRDINAAVGRLLSGSTLADFRANASRVENRALFEIPPILDGILKR